MTNKPKISDFLIKSDISCKIYEFEDIFIFNLYLNTLQIRFKIF